ncbi:MAG: glycosyltransferase [Gallionella sp.]|jgi:hypothetical protein|nr:glycosyltransferase [Gallionella sp.]
MRQHKLFWGSSYDRGSQYLLEMWSEIKAKFPDAELHFAYGWNLFDVTASNNPERRAWKEKIQELMKQPGITEHGRLGKKELKELRQQCGIQAYCTEFTEIFCITAFEASLDGCVPVTTELAALKEFPKGRVIVKGDIYDKETQQEYLKQLLDLMGDEERWKKLQAEGQEEAKNHSWEKVAKDWTKEFEPHTQDIKVSIITPTIRRGFWNIMANNIANQTYKNLEWVIIDDYKQNREETAKEYAKKYKLDIKYYRSKPHKVKRKFSLVNANNTGLFVSTGKLLVILQDFVLMPETGIEELVILHRAQPNCLIAPCDEYYSPKIKPDTESEDWFNGELDIQGEFMRKNVRCRNQGVIPSENPFDFEQNYCAIPKYIAQDLGGWYEFMDESLGFDNTEFAMRALKSGYGLLVDDTNLAVCIDHWNTLEGTEEHGLGRERTLNDPRFFWEEEMLDAGKLPLKRTQTIDDTIELLYTMPDEVPTEDAVKWMRANTKRLVDQWKEEVKL